MLRPQAKILLNRGLLSFESRIALVKNADLCLPGEIGNDAFCDARIEPPVLDGSVGVAVASVQATSASPIETVTDMKGSDMGEPQMIESKLINQNEILKRVAEARVYIQQTVMADEKFAYVRSLCRNEHSQCAYWAAKGECENNPGTL